MCNQKKTWCFDAGVSVLIMPIESTSELLKHYEVYETIGSGKVQIMLLCNALVIVQMRETFIKSTFCFISVIPHRWVC